MPPLKQSDNRGYSGKQIGLCLVAMVALVILGFVWWEISLATMLLLVLGLMCLISAVYTWWIARRVDKVLEKAGLDEALKKRWNKKT